MSTVSATTCQHHWILGEPHGGVVEAVCKSCGHRREYPSLLEEAEHFFDHEEMVMEERLLARDRQPKRAA